MGATLTRWEASIFTGDKNIVGSLELDGYLAADTATGSEKVTNPNFTGAATGWTLGGAWAYNANAVDKNADGTTTLSQDVGAIANEIYRVVYTVSNWSVGTVTVAVGGVSGTARGADGTYTEYIKATGTGSLAFTPTNTARFTVDTVSVTRVGVATTDRVVAWVGDRVAAGVAQAADAGLFLMSEDGTLSFFGDSWKLGAGDDVEFSIPAADTLGISTGGTDALRVTSARALLIGGTAAYADNGQLLEVNKSADDGGIGLFCWSTTDAERALIEFHKSSSATIGTKALVADEEAAGGIIWKVADGAVNWSPIASIEAFVDTAPGAGDTGGRLVLSVTADGATAVTEAVRIDSAGKSTFTASATTNGIVKISNAVSSADVNHGMLNLENTEAYGSVGGSDARIMFTLRSAGGGLNPIASIGATTDGTAAEQGALVFNTRNTNDYAEQLRIDRLGEIRSLAGNVKIANATDGGTGGLHIRSKRAISAAMSGATVNIATQIPSGAIILGAQFNVDTLIEGATTWSAAFNTGSTTSLGSGYALAQNTKVNFLVAPEKASAATDITLTAAGSNFTAGVVEAIVYYIDQTSMANA